MKEMKIAGTAGGTLAYPILDLGRIAGIGKNKAYRLIADGRLRAVRSGGRTLVPAESLREYLASLPAVAGGKPT